MSRRRGTDGPDGLVVVDKEAGWTSHDVVAKLRGILRQRRTGHAGTLDPSATGVLLVGVGRVTRLMRFLQDTSKVYKGTLLLGATTTTLDADGDITATFDMASVAPNDVVAAATSLTGDILQIPPMVSAVKIGGERLYEAARRGEEIERPPRPVRVERFDLEVGEQPGEWRFEVTCSSGTYVRSLVDDLGRSLGGGAHMTGLRRLSVGVFTIADAHRLGEIVAATDPNDPAASPMLLSPAAAMRGLASIEVLDAQVELLATGRRIDDPRSSRGSGPVAVLGPGGALVAVCEPKGTAELAPAVVMVAR